MVHVEELPNELVENILYNVDQETLRSSCNYVSHSWRKIIQSVPFWKRYHRYWDNLGRRKSPSVTSLNAKQTGYIPDKLFLDNHDWHLFSLINPKANPFEINLLQNSDGNLVSENELNVQNNRFFEGEL